MYQAGLVSISFRKLTAEQIIAAAKDADLSCIEWGSDVHAPCDDLAKVSAVAAATQAAGLTCCSYGTYFYLGETPISQLSDYIAAAKLLGTDILRLWCGKKSTCQYTPEEAEALYAVCREAAAIAEQENVTLCMECHPNTYTEELGGALALMQAVDNPHFRMYWQPNQYRTEAEKLAYAQGIAPYVKHIHVYQWKGKEHFPLSGGIDQWQKYLSHFSGDHCLLLEFMPNHIVEELPAEAAALRRIIGGTL